MTAQPSTSAQTGPLTGVRVIDMTAVGMGPYCTQTLGDYGADVIKIEAPDGDVFRHATPKAREAMAAPYLQLNRNKRSLVLNLRQADDLDLLRDLIRQADVLVYNIRPQAMRKLGLDYETLAADNPKLIHCGVYGFSENGPYAGKPAFDDIIQASSGLADLQGRGRDGTPAYVSSIIADKVTGLMGVNAILAALYERTASGQGQAVEVPMFETMVSFNLIEHMGGATFDGTPTEMGYERALSPYRKPYRTQDGFIGLLPYTSEQWKRFFEVAGRPEIMDDPKYREPGVRAQNIGELYAILETLTPQKTSDDWIALLTAADVPVTRVNTLEHLLEDPHLKAIDLIQTLPHPTEGTVTIARSPVNFSRTPTSIRRVPPTLGQHSNEIRASRKFETKETE